VHVLTIFLENFSNAEKILATSIKNSFSFALEYDRFMAPTIGKACDHLSWSAMCANAKVLQIEFSL
jgi:hypothetical protein